MVAGGRCVFAGNTRARWHCPKATDICDSICTLSAAGFRENFHKVPLTVLTAGGVFWLLALMGFDATGSLPS